MKKMRAHLYAVGASLVLTLSVVLAQDLAPAVAQMPDPAPEAPAVAPAAAVPAEPVKRAPTPTPSMRTLPLSARRPVVTAPANARPAPAPANARPAPAPANARPAPAPANAQSAVDSISALGSASTDEDKTAEGVVPTKTTTPALKFDNAPADIIVSAYCEQTGKTPLWAPDVPKANITLKSQQGAVLTKEEFIEAIEVVLSMNGIVLEPFGEKFIKVLARKSVRTDGIKIIMESPDGGHPEKSKVVSQMIQLKSISVAEVQKALEGFKKPEGQFQVFERTNSILVTDTQENVNRMLEIVKFIDQPFVATEEVNVRTIRYAKAEDIKKRIEELVAESQKQSQAKDEIKANPAGSPGITRTAGSTSSSTRPTLTGLTRIGSTSAAKPATVTPNETLEALVSDADRGMIRGKVQIIADERTNQLIIITRAENMNFFDRIITLLDIETAPDVKVEVQRLEYADAEEVSSMLNDLIGNASAAKKDAKVPSSGTKASKSTATQGSPEAPAKSTTLAEAVAARANSAETSAGEPGTSKLGQLSKDNIKILADKRTNALVMMGSIGDLAAIKEIIKDMDVELSQVLIEVVLLEVILNDEIKTGIDWVQKSIKTQNDASYYGGGGGGSAQPANLLGQALPSAAGVTGIKYWFTLDKLNLDAVISAMKSDSRTKVLQSPVLMTVDNKEASLEATEMAYLYKGVRYSGSQYGGGSEVPDYEQRDFGLSIKVTPRINFTGNVMLAIEAKFETRGADQAMPGTGGSTNSTGSAAGGYPTINTRKMQADVAVRSEQTVILGGLTKRENTQTDAGIPILKDIPYIGRYLFGNTYDTEKRTELMVFLTPYVLTGSEEAQLEAQRRKDSLVAQDVWTKGWSRSTLADPISEKELLKQEERILKFDSEQSEASKAREKLLEKKQLEREQQLLKESKEKADKAADRLLETLERRKNVSAGLIKQVREKTKGADVLQRKPPEPEPKTTFGVMKETESVEVLKPAGVAEPAPAQPPATAEPAPAKPPATAEPAPAQPPAQPQSEEPKKSWWKRFFKIG